MEFVRKKKRGQNQKVRKYWFSEEHYRIVWRKEVFGIQVPARFQACVRTIIPNYSGEEGKNFEMWDFVTKPRLYKTLRAAEEDCERHKRLWTKACEATGIRGLLEIFGKLPMGIPVWARKKLPRKVLEILSRPRMGKKDDECEPSLDDPTRTSDCSVSSTEATLEIPTLVSSAKGKDGIASPTSGQPSPTSTEKSDAKPAVEPAKAPKKRVVKRTSTRSKPTGKRKQSTKGSVGNAKKPSKGSAKKKSKPSKS